MDSHLVQVPLLGLEEFEQSCHNLFIATPLVARMRLTLPKVGTWSPSGLPRLQSSISEVKTACLEVFFIPLERSQSVDVQNGLA